MGVLTFGWSNADIQQVRRWQAQNNHMLSSVMAYQISTGILLNLVFTISNVVSTTHLILTLHSRISLKDFQ